MKLTKTIVETLELPEPPKTQKFYWADDPKGFGVRVTETGSRSYIVQRMVNGKSVRFTIGQHGVLTLEQARDRARKRLVEMVDGINPHDAKRAARAQTETLEELAADYCANKRTRHGPLRPASIGNINGYVNGIFKEWKNRQVGSITRADVVTRYREASATAPANANQAFRILKALFNWYQSKHQADDGTCSAMPANPVAVAFRQGGQVRFSPERVRDSRIPRAKIGAVWLELQSLPTVGSDLVQFLILSGCRVGEACQLKWADVKLGDPVPTYHLPATLTKTHIPLTHPISSAMRAVLERRLLQRSEGEEYVFPAVRSKKATYFREPQKVFKRLSEVAGCYLHAHAMRRTTESILQALDVDSDTRRAILNHVPLDIHARHYSSNEPAHLLPALEGVSTYVLEQARLAATVGTTESSGQPLDLDELHVAANRQ